ncbi:LOW QUALITY PROTEIN: POU domain, class 5, transcription factor 2 [Puma concolor]|uniref:LOW QUALITY PROTEIN: POU domain, class 5, transcription factor 2 n=1 Tax=Puma concolor TaxID=9696 RepID=A0A6P6HUI9_PUMCO|nr:LOW QUALITY PROTEIN: POU domain, class 5, transcription factor 2 [Puma concolor]
MAGPRPSYFSPLPGSGSGGPRGPVPVRVDTPVWLTAQAAPSMLMVQPGIQQGVSPGPEVWEMPLGPLPYKFWGGMAPCTPGVGTGKVGAWFPSPSEGTFPRPYIVLQCIPRLALPEDVSAIEKEMEQLAKELRRKRMALGYSQANVAFAVGALFGKVLSQATVCRFEAQQLSIANMWKLGLLMKMWLEEVDTKNFMGVCKIEMILQQARKRRQESRERRIVNYLEKLFLQCPKPTPQQISRIAGQLRLQKELVRVWFYNRNKMGGQPTIDFSPQEDVGAGGWPPFPGGAVCFPLASGPHFGSPCYEEPYFIHFTPYPVEGTHLSAPATPLGYSTLSN